METGTEASLHQKCPECQRTVMVHWHPVRKRYLWQDHIGPLGLCEQSGRLYDG